MADFLLRDQVSSCAALRTLEFICRPPQQSPAGLLAFAFRPAGLVLAVFIVKNTMLGSI